MKNLIIATLMMTLSAFSYAYEGEPSKQVDLFFADLSSGDTNKAIDNLYSSNPLMQQKIQALTVLKQQLSSVTPLYGKFNGSENISSEEISPSITRISQVARHEFHPVIWEFYFYKTNGKWIISQAMFVDQFQVVGAKK